LTFKPQSEAKPFDTDILLGTLQSLVNIKTSICSKSFNPGYILPDTLQSVTLEPPSEAILLIQVCFLTCWKKLDNQNPNLKQFSCLDMLLDTSKSLTSAPQNEEIPFDLGILLDRGGSTFIRASI
jgi:hypothetical protein